MDDKSIPKLDEAKVLKEAKQRYSIASDAWSEHQRSSRDLLKFINGDQWDYQLKENRNNAGLPVLTANRLPAFLRQITNETRQNTPAIQVDPQDEQSAETTGDILADMCRSIESDSVAEIAYDTAMWYSAAVGLGYVRVVSDYISPDAFEQKLLIKSVDDPSTVLMDPNHRSPDGSDQEYAFVLSELSKDDYMRQFGASKLAGDVKTKGWTSNYNAWQKEDTVTIAEYYFKDYIEKTLYKLFHTLTGTTITSFVAPNKEDIANGVWQIVAQRKTSIPIIRWVKMNDVEILDETTWPGAYIPVIPFKGEETWIEGQRFIKGVVEDAVDSQRALNYFYSQQAELVSLAPKAPYIGTVEQFANFEHMWRDANAAPFAYLPYNPVEGAPPPARDVQEVPIQAAMNMCAQSVDNLKSIFGVFDASLGNQSNETSGVAILARVEQAHTTNYHFQDNQRRSIAQIGRVLIDAIPEFYPEENRLLQLTKINGDRKAQTVNNGEIDITTGKWAVTVESGPSYSTKRQAAIEGMAALGQVYPNAMPVIADLIAENSDWPQAKVAAKRLRAVMPPQVLEATSDDSNQDAEALVPQLKSINSQQTQQLQAITVALQEQKKELELTKHELSLVKMGKEVEMRKAEMDYKIDERKMDIQEAEIELQFRLDERKLALEEEQLKIAAIQAGADVADSMMEHSSRKAAHEHKVRMDISMPVSKEEMESGITDLGGELNAQ